MGNYTKIVDYAAKDLLLTGDPAKAGKGTEIGAEFDAIAAMSATKAELAGSATQAFSASTFTGAGTGLTGTAAGLTAGGNSALLAASSGASLVGFLAGTGAVARTVQSKGRDFISVKDFGAVGDGTTDDTAAIQAAINFAQTNTRALYFPSNGVSQTYKTTAPLLVTTPLRIIGESSRFVVIQAVGLAIGQYVLDIDGTTFGTYEQGEFSGFTLMAGAGDCMRIKNVSNSIFRDMGLRQARHGITYTGTRCFSNSFEKIYTITGITGSTFFMSAHTGGGHHTFNDCSLGGSTGFSLSSDTVTDNLVFNGVNFEQCLVNGVSISGTVEGLLFSGCRTEGGDSVDFVINPASTRRVSGLVITGTTFGSSDAGAVNRVDLGGAGGVVRGFNISGNTVMHSTGGFAANLVRLNGEGESGVISGNYLNGLIASCDVVSGSRPGVSTFNNEGNNGKFADRNFATYEEGTWTPIDSSGAALALTGSSGTFTRIGKLVTWRAVVVYPTTTNTADSLIGGFPYTLAGGSPVLAGANVSYAAVGTAWIQIRQVNASTTFQPFKTGNARATNANLSGSETYISGQYMTT